MGVAGYVREVHNKGGNLDVGPFYRESEHIGGILADCWGCHAASTHLAFLPNGQITGCSVLAMMANRFPELILGDVFGGIEQQAVDHMIGLAQAIVEQRSLCHECHAASNCTGGCLAINYATTGIPLLPPPIYCSIIAAIPTAWQKAWAENDAMPGVKVLDKRSEENYKQQIHSMAYHRP